MSCEQFRAAISEAAALQGGAVLQERPTANAALQEHLDGCVCCREWHASEQNLFAAMDGELFSLVNADASPSFLPRVRAAIELEHSAGSRSRSWFVLWPAAVAMVAVCLAVLVFQRIHTRPQIAPRTAESASATSSATTSATDSGIDSATSGIASDTGVLGPQAPHRGSRHDVLKTLSIRPVVATAKTPTRGSQNFEVLVPPDEREALARFVAELPRRHELAIALTKPSFSAPSLELSLIHI